MNRKTKITTWLVAFSSCFCGPMLSNAAAQNHAAGNDAAMYADSQTQYGWKVGPADNALPPVVSPPSHSNVPIVRPGDAMEILNAPALKFPRTNNAQPNTNAQPNANAQIVPPVVAAEQAAPIRPGTDVDSMLKPVQPASTARTLAPVSGAPVSGMPGQYANTYQTSEQQTDTAAQAYYRTNEAAVGSGVASTAAGPSSMDQQEDTNVLPVAAQWATGSNGYQPAQQNYSTPSTGLIPRTGTVPPVVSSSTATSSPPPAASRAIRPQETPMSTMTPYDGGTVQGALSGGMESFPQSVMQPSMPMDSMSMPMDSSIPLQPMDSYQYDPNMNSMPYAMDQSMVQSAPMMNNSFIQPPVGDAPFASDCTTCGGGPSVAGCSQCGVNGCYDQSQMAARFASCGAVAGARRYFHAEAMLINRGDSGGFGATNAGQLGRSDWDAGWRFTLGRRYDYTNGVEFTYMGTSELSARRETVTSGNVLNAVFGAGGFFGATEIGSFFNANRQVEFRSTALQSFEYHRVRWNWDVFKTHIGLRAINVADDYNLFSENTTSGSAGSISYNTNNFLLGPQLGGELFYDVGYRYSWSIYSKIGVYANFNELDFSLINNGTQFVNNDSSSFDIAGVLEIGLVGHYQLSSRARLRGGYTLLWLNNLAGAVDNVEAAINNNTGNSIRTEEEMFFHGLSGGLEIFW